MRRLSLTAAFLALSASGALAQPTSAPSSGPTTRTAKPRQTGPRALLQAALDLYVAGQYREAARRLRPLVETKALKDRADHLEALRSYGVALYLMGAKAGAERAFRELLRLSPREKLDPSFVRPKVVAFFEDVKRRYRAELDRVVKRSAPRGSALVNLLPPWGQFRNGQPVKGYVILAGELSMAIASAVSGALLYSWRGEAGQFHDRDSTARTLRVVNWVSFAAAAAFAVYGMVDGLYHYYRRPKAKWGSERKSARSPTLFRF